MRIQATIVSDPSSYADQELIVVLGDAFEVASQACDYGLDPIHAAWISLLKERLEKRQLTLPEFVENALNGVRATIHAGAQLRQTPGMTEEFQYVQDSSKLAHAQLLLSQLHQRLSTAQASLAQPGDRMQKLAAVAA